MVHLTRLNNQPVIVNSDLIKFVEQAPDTLITLVNGEKFIVREGPEEIIKRVVEYRQSVLETSCQGWRQVSVKALGADLDAGTSSKG
jgi:flagellar protein FlbD